MICLVHSASHHYTTCVSVNEIYCLYYNFCNKKLVKQFLLSLLKQLKLKQHKHMLVESNKTTRHKTVLSCDRVTCTECS